MKIDLDKYLNMSPEELIEDTKQELFQEFEIKLAHVKLPVEMKNITLEQIKKNTEVMLAEELQEFKKHGIEKLGTFNLGVKCLMLHEELDRLVDIDRFNWDNIEKTIERFYDSPTSKELVSEINQFIERSRRELRKSQKRTGLQYRYWQEMIDEVVEIHRTKKQELSKGIKKKELRYVDLFRDKSKAQMVKQIFEFHNYTVDGKWIGLTNNKNELASAFYVLKNEEFDFCLIAAGKSTTQIIPFYKEFGLNVKPKDGEKPYCSIRNISPFPGQNAETASFEKLFKPLKENK